MTNDMDLPRRLQSQLCPSTEVTHFPLILLLGVVDFLMNDYGYEINCSPRTLFPIKLYVYHTETA